ncbi:MAG: plastocyanin/azurin family copper-binding protein [Proteobacteria bacterium]|nr:plastocyanin/azurin family copper-binding protein [Pseudomonadota bacterium]
MAIKKTLLSLSTTIFLATTGCTVGGGDLSNGGEDLDNGSPGGTDPGDQEPQANYTVSVTSPITASLTLGNSADFEISLQSQNFAGPVTLAVANVPSSWEAAFTPEVVSLQKDGSATATLSVVVPTNAEAMSAQIDLQASAAPGQRQGQITVDVANQLIIDITDGTGGNLHPFPPTVEVRSGATVIFQNSDGTPGEEHRIHADADRAGFPHQPGSMSQGQNYTVEITVAGTYDYYCHEHEKDAGLGQIVIVDPAPAP